MPFGRTIYEKCVFLDTGAFIALNDSNDRHHEVANKCIASIKASKLPIFVSNVTIIESYKRLLFDKGYADAVNFLRDIYDKMQFNIIRPNHNDEVEAKRIIEKFSDQMFSFADAVNFSLMKREGLLKVFAFDHHYTVFGFITIPPLI